MFTTVLVMCLAAGDVPVAEPEQRSFEFAKEVESADVAPTVSAPQRRATLLERQPGLTAGRAVLGGLAMSLTSFAAQQLIPRALHSLTVDLTTAVLPRNASVLGAVATALLVNSVLTAVIGLVTVGALILGLAVFSAAGAEEFGATFRRAFIPSVAAVGIVALIAYVSGLLLLVTAPVALAAIILGASAAAGVAVPFIVASMPEAEPQRRGVTVAVF